MAKKMKRQSRLQSGPFPSSTPPLVCSMTTLAYRRQHAAQEITSTTYQSLIMQ
ncbi:hypothetical protein Patl1_22294 [Pistacia atlantica]|uniref:Uncharacterized protein n=1 Tax=Pistacia atlantica TaxID=434234 RepID=A0ACC0ZYT9_9ROSI|nr:hypothetical protein Patl1_22294 [Pistacia atlantica]